MLVLHDAKNACHEGALTAGGPSRPGVRQSVAARVTLIDHHLVAVTLHRALPIALHGTSGHTHDSSACGSSSVRNRLIPPAARACELPIGAALTCSDELLSKGCARSMEAYANVIGSCPQPASDALDRDFPEVHLPEHVRIRRGKDPE